LVDTDEDPLVGRTLDRYQVIQPLGSGGMGSVYRAEHVVLHHEYALKVLFGELAADEKLVARFTREAKYLSQISHENVVKVVDFGTTTSGLTFLVMEYLHGLSLAEMINLEEKLSPKDVAVIAKQILSGLQAVHDAGFVHRDVKPGNIMLVHQNGRDSAKLLDFGLASILDDEAKETKLTKTGQTVGTPSYMAPEQIRAGVIGPAADVYSMGVVMYEALTGNTMYEGTSSEVMVKHLVDPIPVIEAMNGIENVVQGCLHKKPEDRLTIPQLIPLLEAWTGDEIFESSVNIQSISESSIGAGKSEAALASVPLRTSPDISSPPSSGTVQVRSRRFVYLFAGLALFMGVLVGYAVIKGPSAPEVTTVPRGETKSVIPPPTKARPSKLAPAGEELKPKPKPVAPAEPTAKKEVNDVPKSPKPQAKPVETNSVDSSPAKAKPTPRKTRPVQRSASRKKPAKQRVKRVVPKAPPKPVAPPAPVQPKPKTQVAPPSASVTAVREQAPGRLNVVAVFNKRPRPVELFVDGKPRGMTPLRLKLAPGKYKVEIRPVGLQPRTRLVEIQSEKTQRVIFDLSANE